MITNVPLLFFVDQSPVLVEQFRLWLRDTGVQCIVVEPVSRAFSLIVRDNPWGVVLTLDDELGQRLCAQIREDDLLESVKIIALSKGGDNAEITKHMFGEASADVYGKFPLEDGVIEQWLNTHVPSEHTDTAEVEIELTSELLVTKPMVSSPSSGDGDIKIARLELELFEQGEQLSDTNRSLLRSKLQVQELSEQNTVLSTECERLASLLSEGVSDQTLQEENERLRNRLQVMEIHIAQIEVAAEPLEVDELAGLSTKELMAQIQVLKRERDDKTTQVNQLHGELQLTRQAVDSLRSRTTKAEERLTETQDLGVLREQQLQRELMTLQRQVGNQNRSMELSQHREQQLTQQIESLQTSIHEIQQSHESERSTWLTDERLNQSSKEPELLLEIQTLTDALQAQLLAEDSDAAEEALVASYTRQLTEKDVLLEHVQSEIARLTNENQRLQEAQSSNAAPNVAEKELAEQQEVLNSTLKSLEDSLIRQEELEAILLQLQQQSAEVVTTDDGILREEQERNAQLIQELTAVQTQVRTLQEQLQSSVDETIALKTTHEAALDDLVNQVTEEVSRAWQERLDIAEVEFERDKLTWQSMYMGSVEEAEDAEAFANLRISLNDMTILKSETEQRLYETQERVEDLQNEKTNLERALADSQAMADVLESTAESEVRTKDSEIQELQARLEEGFVNYRELEEHAAQVIGERDDLWVQVEASKQTHIQLQSTIEQLNTQLLEAQAEQENLQIQLQELIQKQKDLEAQHSADLISQQESFDGELTTLSNKVSGLQEQLTSTQSEVEVTTGALEEKTAELASIQAALERAISEQASVQTALESSEAKINELEEMLHVSTTTKDILSTELATMTTQIKELSAERDEVRESLDAAELSLVEFEGQRAEFDVERQALSLKIDSLQHQLMEYSAEMEAVNETLESLRAEKNQLVETVSKEREEAANNLSETQEGHAQLQLEYEQIKTEYAGASAEYTVQKNELESRITTLEAEYAAIDQELQSLKEEQIRQEAEWSERLENERQRQSLDVQQQIEEIQTSLDSANQALVDGRATAEQLELERDQLQVQIEELQSVQTELHTTKNQVQDLQTSLDAALTQVHVLEQKVLNNPQSLQSSVMEDDNTSNSSEVTETTNVPIQSNIGVQEMQTQLVSLRQHRAELLAKIDQMQENKTRQQQRIQELISADEGVVAQLQEERDDAQAELAMLQIELGLAQSTSRQIAQRAEMIRESALEARTRWQQELQEKEEINRRLRARIEKMERGLSAMFVKHPTV